MVLTIVAGIAGAAFAAIMAYRSARNADPEATKEAVAGFLQVVGVFAAIVNGTKAVLDALTGAWQPALAGAAAAGQQGRIRVIGRPAGEAVAELGE